MAKEHIDLPQGTLDLLILRTLTLDFNTAGVFQSVFNKYPATRCQVKQGSLYPALHRLQQRGWIKPRWATTENNRRAKYYELTPTGRKHLQNEESGWRQLVAAVSQVLENM